MVSITQPEKQIFVRTSTQSKYIVEYHRDACIGAGTCAAIAPHTFAMDEENKAVIVDLPESEDSDEEILAAAMSCPVFAIVIKDKETGEQVFPPTDLND